MASTDDAFDGYGNCVPMQLHDALFDALADLGIAHCMNYAGAYCLTM